MNRYNTSASRTATTADASTDSTSITRLSRESPDQSGRKRINVCQFRGRELSCIISCRPAMRKFRARLSRGLAGYARGSGRAAERIAGAAYNGAAYNGAAYNGAAHNAEETGWTSRP